MLTAEVFLEEVVRPNVAAQRRNVGDMRLAVNAILAADAFWGLLHAEWKNTNGPAGHPAPPPDDGTFRAKVAARNQPYRLLRDFAFAIKHGELVGSKPRLVRKPNVKPLDRVWDDNAIWSDDEYWSDTETCIETDASEKPDLPAGIAPVKSVLAAAVECAAAARPGVPYLEATLPDLPGWKAT
ncbi:hypothetical protein [Rhodobacteraceae bacterium DSL-40]|uniref:hypothetical protein n=1 Tax=Amaricoccus sp. B4 TaxID=3368557 RepID=UPI000DAF3237